MQTHRNTGTTRPAVAGADRAGTTRTTRVARRVALRAAATGTALVAALGLAACGSGDGDTGTTASATATSAGSATASAAPETTGDATGTADGTAGGDAASPGFGDFTATAADNGYTCVEADDPFLHRPAVTCSPSADQASQRATFSLFPRDEIGSGADAARLARESMTGTGAGDTSDLPDIPGLDQLGDALSRLTAGPQNFRAVDSDSLAGYCVDSQGTCATSGLDAMGLTLG